MNRGLQIGVQLTKLVVVSGWSEVEDRLAEWFGLDQSKYQWAVDELLERQLVSGNFCKIS